MAVVDAPELPPLLFNRNGKYTYVCSYENAWDSERLMSVRVKGKTYTVGKIIGGELTGTIEWSEDFLGSVQKNVGSHSGSFQTVIPFLP